MKILVGYDGSPAALTAVNLSVKYAKAFNARILLVTSLVGGTMDNGNEIHHAEEEFETIKELFAKENIPCTTDMLISGLSAGDDILRYAEENQVDHIILGIKKKSRTGKLLFGSNAQYVILNAHCPVITVH